MLEEGRRSSVRLHVILFLLKAQHSGRERDVGVAGLDEAV